MGIRIRPAEIEVPCNDPFQNDLLDRKESAEILTRLVDNIEGPCVLTIDAPWGAGKTTFLKMWSRHLRNNGFQVVEFNAWETDHAEDPFVAMASELEKGLREFDDGSFTANIENTMKAAKKVALRAIPGIIRIVTAGLLDVDQVIKKEAGKLLASYAENRLGRYKENQESIKEFRKRLQEMASSLAQSTDHPLMVVIDELDRCRPSYAVALIEVAKHLFDADHVVFVLAVNRTQLAHSIRALYGNEFDATGYLRRFFDIDFRLPEPDRTGFIQDLLNRIQIGPCDLLKEFFGSSHLSLRQVRQVIHRFGLAAASLQNTRPTFLMTIEVALIVRAIDTDLYKRFVQGDLPDQELVDAIYERVRIVREYTYIFETIIVMAAREIASRNKNMRYDKQIESPLIDRYREQADDHGKQVIECVQRYEQEPPINRTGLGFLDAVRRIELFGGGTNVREWWPMGLPH